MNEIIKTKLVKLKEEFLILFANKPLRSTHQPTFCPKEYCILCGNNGNLICFENPETFKCYLICEQCRDRLYDNRINWKQYEKNKGNN